MSKFVVDTNVIMLDPNCINKIDGMVILTSTVLEELDKHKTDNGEIGRNVREFARLLDKESFDNYSFHQTSREDEYGGVLETNDDKIIDTAFIERATLITNDILMSLKAKAMGVDVQRYEPVNIISDSAYTGLIDSREKDIISPREIANLHPNQYHLTKHGLFKQEGGRQKRLSKDKNVWGITHKNVEQKCALDALMDDDVKLITISGKAGTGKTLLAIAAGLELTLSKNTYQRLLISRPVVPMGNDIGFLPGTVDEKLGPWMQPIFDNIDFLFNVKDRTNSYDAYKDLIDTGILKIEPLTYIRGRSIPEQFIIIDEAQNLSKHEVKTIITRVGHGTKIILTGDPDQIDNPRLDSVNNGLTYVIEKFKDQNVAAHITLSKGERSELAEVATDIM